jgi:Fic family protein
MTMVMGYEPRYVITHPMLKYVGQIEAAREVISQAALVPAYEAQFRADALSRTVHHGTHLEGNALSQAQVEKVVLVDETLAERAAEKAGIVGRDRDVQEVINYRKVMDWIDEIGIKARVDVKLSDKILKDIHEMTTYRILPDEERGKLRAVEVVVRNSKTKHISFRPPPAVEVPHQMKQFFAWVNSEEGAAHHPILRAGITHYELVRIHPFTDGNGRVARAMALLLLYLEGYEVKRFFSLEEYFDSHAVEYYAALQSVMEGGGYDLTNWLEYFALGLSIELDRVKQQVLKLSRDLHLKAQLGHQVALSERQIKILEVMQNNAGRVISSDLEKILPMVSVDTILRDLKDLLNKGLIRKRGRTKGAYYELSA